MIVVRRASSYPVPDRLDDVHAAALIANYVTAEIAIAVFAELKPTDRIVHAAAEASAGKYISSHASTLGTIIGTARGPEKGKTMY